jgi:hypothetical protein
MPYGQGRAWRAGRGFARRFCSFARQSQTQRWILSGKSRSPADAKQDNIIYMFPDVLLYYGTRVC